MWGVCPTLGCVSLLSFSCRRDCDVVGASVMRFGIRSLEDILLFRNRV